MGFVAGSTGDKLMEEMMKDLGNSRSPRTIIPIIHLYLDHMMSLLIEARSSVAKELLGDNIRSSFTEKSKILYALHEISQDEFKELKLINRIRNNFAHSFNPDEDDIKDDAMKLKFHVYNEKRSYIEMVLYSGIQLITYFDQKLMNAKLNSKT